MERIFRFITSVLRRRERQIGDGWVAGFATGLRRCFGV